MKQNILLWVSTLVLMMIFAAFTGYTGSEGNVNPEIELVKRSGGTRSGTATEVGAFIFNGHTLTVEIKNYTGMVWVDVTGAGGIWQQAIQVNDSGSIETDLSQLPQGGYLLSITLENEVYEGEFEI